MDRKEDERSKKETEKEKQYHRLKKMKQPGADHEARWVKKSGHIVYGLKKHIATDGNGMALGVHTTTANEHDSRGLAGIYKNQKTGFTKLKILAINCSLIIRQKNLQRSRNSNERTEDIKIRNSFPSPNTALTLITSVAVEKGEKKYVYPIHNFKFEEKFR